MQSAEEFAGRLRYREIEEQWDGENETYVDVGFGLSDQDAIEEVAARDAEWQTRVDQLEAALDYAIACLPDAPLNAKEKLRAALRREA